MKRGCWAALLLGALIHFSCGGTQHPASDSSTIAPARLPAGAVSISDADVEGASAYAEPSEFQLALLADGVLTLEDYETAYVALVDCLEEAGWQLSRQLRPNLFRGHSFHGFHPTADARAFQARKDCQRDFVGLINFLWVRTHGFSQEQIDAARRDLAACLADSGAEIERTASAEDIKAYLDGADHRSNPQRFVECQIRIESEHGIPDFAGG